MKKLRYLLFVLLLFYPVLVFALQYPVVKSEIVEIYDLSDDKIIYEVDSKSKSAIASLTKIATTITAIENIKNLDEKVTITKEILNTVDPEASRAGLKEGDVLTYRDLLYASMLPSGADATNTIAISSSGSVSDFVKKMNELMNKINLKSTHFVNVTGLDEDDHYSSADDVRKLLVYALKNPLFREIYTTKKYTMSNGQVVKSTIFTYNKNSNIDTSKILGSKTGFTLKAGYCLSTLSNINGHEMLTIVLKAPKEDNYYYNIIDSVSLINFLLDNYKEQVLVKKKELVKTLPIKLSKEEKYDIKASKEVKLYLPSDYDKNKFKIKYDGIEELSFRNKINKKIGTIKYYYDNKLIAEEEIILNKEIKVSIKKLFINYYYILIILLVIIIFIIIIIFH